VAHLPGDEHDIRALVSAADEAYRFMRDNVLRSGLVDPELKELCFRYLEGDAEVTDFSRFGEREQAALRWAHAIAWDSSQADDELWSALHAHFSEPELVELGCAIGFELGQQHWRRTVGLPVRDQQPAAF
jgi:alkylhydroperoxidase family enzyme